MRNAHQVLIRAQLAAHTDAKEANSPFHFQAGGRDWASWTSVDAVIINDLADRLGDWQNVERWLQSANL
jgi:hypothetical protein